MYEEMREGDKWPGPQVNLVFYEPRESQSLNTGMYGRFSQELSTNLQYLSEEDSFSFDIKHVPLFTGQIPG